MPFLDLPAEFAEPSLLIPGIKPVGPVQVKQGHMGLRVDHFYMLGGTHTDLVTGDRADPQDATGNTWEHDAFTEIGVGCRLNPTANAMSPIVVGDTVFESPSEPVTYIWHFRPDAFPNQIGLAPEAYNNYGFRIRITSATEMFFGHYRSGVNDSMTPSFSFSSILNRATVLVYHFNPDTGDVYIAVNGESTSRSPGTGGWDSPPSGEHTIADGWNEQLSGDIWSLVRLKGAMSQGDCEELSRQGPYQFLEPVARPSIFLPEAAAGGGYFLQLPPEFADPTLMIPRHKPVGPVVAKHGHKGQKVVHWYDFGGETAQDLISKHVAYPTTDFGTDMWDFDRIGTPKGKALHSPNSSTPSGGSIRCDLYTGAFTAPTVPTTFIYHLQHDAANATGNPLELAAGTWNQDGWTCNVQETGGNQRWSVAFYQSGSGTEYVLVDNPVFGEEEVVVVHYDPDGENCWVVVNEQIASNFSTFAVYEDNTSVNGGTARMFNGWEEELQGKFWMHARLEGRVMSEAELLDIAADPYQFLTPAQAPMIWVPDAASPTGGYWIPDPRWEDPGLMVPHQRPVVPVEVDYSHPIMKDICAWLTGGQKYDYVRGTDIDPAIPVSHQFNNGVADIIHGPGLQAWLFNGGEGSDDYIRHIHPFDRPSATAVTCVCWINSSFLVGNQDILQDVGDCFVIRLSGPTPQFYIRYESIGWQGGNASYTVSADTWYMMALTVEPDGASDSHQYGYTFDEYGNTVGSTYWNPADNEFFQSTTGGQDFLVGIHAGRTGSEVEGMVRDVMYWTRALTEKELQQIAADPYQFLIPA